MKYFVDFQNTGYIEDGILRIEPDLNDGTEIKIEKRDKDGMVIGSAVLDVEALFENGGKVLKFFRM